MPFVTKITSDDRLAIWWHMSMFMTNKLVNRLCTKGLVTTCKYNAQTIVFQYCFKLDSAGLYGMLLVSRDDRFCP